jgi:hypothetical protein
MRLLPLLLAFGCIRLPATSSPPMAGYGDPYKGSGKPIYVKDSRDDWDITEGPGKISSEKALEASGDPEYEARRQLAKAHNDKLYGEGKRRRSRGKTYAHVGLGMLIAGIVVAALVPNLVASETITPASNAMPEIRESGPSGASKGAAYGGVAFAALGAAILGYGYIGGRKQPPYHVWRTPPALDRPAYIREKTEALNEKLGAPPVEDQPGGVDDLPLAPGQRKPPPARPTTLKMRGGK